MTLLTVVSVYVVLVTVSVATPGVVGGAGSLAIRSWTSSLVSSEVRAICLSVAGDGSGASLVLLRGRDTDFSTRGMSGNVRLPESMYMIFNIKLVN